MGDILGPAVNPGQEGTGFTSSHIASPYTEYTVTVRYRYRSGRTSVPRGDGGTVAARLQLHAPFAQKVVEWTAVRVGAPPDLPDPTPTSSNEELAEYDILPQATTLEPDGQTRRYTVAGLYVYHVSEPDWLEQGIPFPTPPYQVARNGRLTRANFVGGII